jgi:hypothetical protein
MALKLEQPAGTGANAGFDRTAQRFNQSMLIAGVVLAFVFDLIWIVPALALVLALGTIDGRLALFQRIYRDLLRPAGLLKPDLHAEDAAPHRFAQGLGASVLALAALALLSGATVLGWGLALLVGILAAVNLFFGFCLGCFMYLQLARLRQAR